MKQIFTEQFKQDARELQRAHKWTRADGWRDYDDAVADAYCPAEKVCKACEHYAERQIDWCDACDDCEKHEDVCWNDCIFKQYDCHETIKMLLAMAREA